MRNFKLPEKVRRFLVPGVLFLAIFLFAGGLYFRRRSLLLSSQSFVSEEEGTVSGVRTNVPENFPPDIPLFEPAEILSSLESQERIQVTLQTEVSAGRVSQFYQQGMKDLGWKLTGRGMANDNGVLSFEKSERHAQLVITSDPEGGSTLIILGITP